MLDPSSRCRVHGTGCFSLASCAGGGSRRHGSWTLLCYPVAMDYPGGPQLLLLLLTLVSVLARCRLFVVCWLGGCAAISFAGWSGGALFSPPPRLVLQQSLRHQYLPCVRMLIVLKAGNRSMAIVGHVELLETSTVAVTPVSVLHAHDHASCANQTKNQLARTIFNYTLVNATDDGVGVQNAQLCGRSGEVRCSGGWCDGSDYGIPASARHRRTMRSRR